MVGGLPVLTTRNPLRDLLVATRQGAIQQGVSGVDLEEVLQHVADAARRLVGAECVVVGLAEDQRPLSSTDQSLLRVPLTVRGKVFVYLYLTGKRDGAEFSAADQELVQVLASAAERAIENAELIAEEQRRQAWQSAMTNVTTLLLSGQDPQAVLPIIIGHAMRLCGAVAAAIVAPTEDPAWFRVTAGTGVLDPRLIGELIPAEGSIFQLVLIGSVALATDDVMTDPRTSGAVARAPGLGPAVGAPLGTETVDAVLLVARTRRASSFRFPDVAMITAFAEHAGLALSLAENRRKRELVRLVEDRERIAAHLSEHAMQALLRISTTVHGLITRMRTPADAQRLTTQVDRLDAVLREMRRAIFGLQHPSSG